MTLRRGGAVVLSLSLSFPPRPHLLGMTQQWRQRDDAAAQSSSPSPFLLLIPTYLGTTTMTRQRDNAVGRRPVGTSSTGVSTGIKLQTHRPTCTLGGGWQPVPGMGADIIAGTRGYTRVTA
ncbi:hypothetical protein OG21DRAFT_1507532 [Imleria badia]|nr:hypothetical protein OG21DRAFT_1507532 [Imleria badia]